MSENAESHPSRIEPGEVWIDPDTGLGWTITEVDGEIVSLAVTVMEERMEHASRLRRLYHHDSGCSPPEGPCRECQGQGA